MADRGTPKSLGELMDGILELFDDNPEFTYSAAGLDGSVKVFSILYSFMVHLKKDVIIKAMVGSLGEDDVIVSELERYSFGAYPDGMTQVGAKDD